MTHRISKSILLSSAAVAGVMIAGPAIAQDVPADQQAQAQGSGTIQDEAAAQAQSASESASQAGAGEAGLQDIVVTARRVGESAQRTPVSITSFSNEDIKTKVVQNTADIGKLTPSLQIIQHNTAPSGLFISMRGQVQTDSAANAPGSVGVYLDDIYIGGSMIAGSSRVDNAV